MSDVPSNGNGSFTQKEILVRLDSKVDSLIQTVASKNAWYDVQIALLQAGQDKLKVEAEERAKDLEATKAETSSIKTRQNIAAGAIAFIIFMAPVLWILVNKLVAP